MPKNSSTADARKRAQALVAQVKKRIARQEGADTAQAETDESADGSGAAAEAESMDARSGNAHGTRTRHALAKSHVTRAQGHAAARTQRTQGRREGK